jgi:hypothetical protein
MNNTRDSSDHSSEHEDCGNGNSNREELSISPQCDAFAATIELEGGFVATCPANFAASGAIAVLTTGLAIVPPPAVTEMPAPPALSAQCAAVLGVARPPPPPSPPRPPRPMATKAPVALVAASVQLGGYTAETFTPALRTGFAAAIAVTLNVDPADIIITNVTDAPAVRRKLMTGSGVVVAFTVAAPTTAAVEEFSTAITEMSSTNADAFTEQLQVQGVTEVTSIAPAAAPQLRDAPAPQDDASGASTLRSTAVSVACLLAAAVAASA